jgi:bacteriorhodopsin
MIWLRNVYYYGIAGACAHWFKTYPTNRKQKINILPQNQKGILFQLENNRKWCTSVINLGAIIIHNLYKYLYYGISPHA